MSFKYQKQDRKVSLIPLFFCKHNDIFNHSPTFLAKYFNFIFAYAKANYFCSVRQCCLNHNNIIIRCKKEKIHTQTIVQGAVSPHTTSQKMEIYT